jgi:hypothetical protein
VSKVCNIFSSSFNVSILLQENAKNKTLENKFFQQQVWQGTVLFQFLRFTHCFRDEIHQTSYEILQSFLCAGRLSMLNENCVKLSFAVMLLSPNYIDCKFIVRSFEDFHPANYGALLKKIASMTW